MVSNNKKIIEHKGIVSKIEGNLVCVSIDSQSACTNCHVKGVCKVTEKEEKIIEIENVKGKFNIGDNVIVYISEHLGFKALFLGYLLPFLLLITTIIVTYQFADNELLIGGLGIFLLIPYYIIIYLLRHRIKESFEFEIRKP